MKFRLATLLKRSNFSGNLEQLVDTATDEPKCSCRKKNACSLNGNCLAKHVIYSCKVKTSELQDRAYYIGLAENSFKGRWYCYRTSFVYQLRNAVERYSFLLIPVICSDPQFILLHFHSRCHISLCFKQCLLSVCCLCNISICTCFLNQSSSNCCEV